MQLTGLISPKRYTDQDHLKNEYSNLFAVTWSFVGLLMDFDENSHIGVNIANIEIILQFDEHGRPHAYRNTCSHRHARLCTSGFNKGVIRCPYHNWVYDQAGIPVVIPQAKDFPDVIANPAAYRLQKFDCETVGQFIFVRLSKNGVGLQEFLGDEYEFLLRASEGMSSVHDEFRREVNANWKVVIENSLEGYHVPYVHHKTFFKVEGMQRGYDAPVNIFHDALHSSMQHPAEENWLASFEQKIEPKIGKWAWRFPYYTHHHIFPNLTVTSFLGYSYHVQRFEPTDVDITTVHSRSVAMKFEEQSPVGAKMIQQIYMDNKNFIDRVFGEDGDICSAVQQGLNFAVNNAVLGNEMESRVHHFHKAYNLYCQS